MRVAALACVFMLFGAVAIAQDAPRPGEGDPHSGVAGAPPMERSLAMAEPSRTVPVGSIEVHIVDEQNHPVSGAEVNVGTMGQEGRRERVVQRTNAEGQATFANLPTGDVQAYRVNLPFAGATYSSTPFRLPTDQGYVVRIMRLPVSRDARFVFQPIGVMMIELREGRLHISQQIRLMNGGDTTYVFPADGTIIPLPQGFLAPQTEPVMTDQHLTPTARGYRLTGSLPPGSVELAWAFDLPLSGTEVSFTQPMAFRTFAFRVLADAAPGMRLDVSGFPPPQVFESENGHLLGTEIEKPVTDPIVRLEVALHDVPGPGPLRWIAVVLAVILLIGGVFFARTTVRKSNSATHEGMSRETALLDEIAALERERQAGKVGPKFFARRKELIVTELALILQAKEAAKASSVSSDSSSSSR